MEDRLVGLSKKKVLEIGTELFTDVKAEIRKVIYGEEMERIIDGTLFSIIGGWHAYLLAAVGLGKTALCLAAGRALSAKFSKIDGQPDLLPKDMVGFLWFDKRKEEFKVVFGPLADGSNIVLLNEINRITPRGQSAALSAMEEREVTIHTERYPLPDVFAILATANPLEYEGVYYLPEAQLDRFTLRLEIPFPSTETMLQILRDPDFWRPASTRILERVHPVITTGDILTLREAIFTSIHVEPRIDEYIDKIVRAILEYEIEAEENGEKRQPVEYVSPRGAIDLKRVAIINAFAEGRKDKNGDYFVTPKDVQRFAVEVLAHRTFLKPGVVADPERETGPRRIAAEVVKNVHFD